MRTFSRIAIVCSLLAAAGCGGDAPPPAGGTGSPTQAPEAAAPLLVHVGGTMRPAFEELCKLYAQETGQKVSLNQGDSGSLMAAVELKNEGDLLVVHDPFHVTAKNKGLAEKAYAVAGLFPVIVVKKGNPKGIKGVKDLARDDVRVGLTDATYSTLGHIMPKVFERAGIAEAMGKKDIPRERSGGETANKVTLDVTDAAVVWNAVAFLRQDKLDTVEIEEAYRPRPDVDALSSATYGKLEISGVGVWAIALKCSKQPEAARNLAELAVSARGQEIFKRFGFLPPPDWAVKAAGDDKPAGTK